MSSILLSAVVVVATSCADAAQAKDVVLFDQKLAVAMGGVEVGTVTAKDVATSDGFRFERDSDLQIQRGTTINAVKSRSVTLVGKDLAPREYRYERTDASGTLKAVGRIEKGELVLVTEQAGGKVENRQPLPAGATFATAMEHVARTNLKDGFTAERSVVLEELGAVAPMSVKVAARAGGFHVSTSMAGLVTEEDVDAAGKTVVARTPAVGLVAYPPGQAPKDGDSGGADLLARSTWPAPRLDKDVARVRYRVTTPDAQTFAIPEDDRQKVVARTGTFVEVEVKAGPSTNKGLAPDERKKRIAATPYEAVDDARIQKAAKDAVQGAKTNDDKARQLVRFVYDWVDAKSLDRGYAPAVATLESKAGDCTEHSVLYSALARALGLPTRLVDGVVVDGGRAGYHEWVEVQVDDKGWVPADPTFGEFPASPARLKLAEGSSSPDEQLALSLAASRLLKPGVKIEVVDATPPAH